MKIVPYVIMVLFCIGLFFAGQMRGSLNCQLKQASATTTEVKKEIVNNEKIKQKLYKLSDPDLDKRLAPWLRD